MNPVKANGAEKKSTDKSKVGTLFPNASLEDYAQVGRNSEGRELEDELNILRLSKNKDENNDSDEGESEREKENADRRHEEDSDACTEDEDYDDGDSLQHKS